MVKNSVLFFLLLLILLQYEVTIVDRPRSNVKLKRASNMVYDV